MSAESKVAAPVGGRPELVARIQQAFNELKPPKMTEARAEYWKAGARAAIAAVNSAIRAPQGGRA